MDKKHRYSAGMLAAALIVGIGIGFCGGFAVGGHTGSRQQNTTAGAEQNFETGEIPVGVIWSFTAIPYKDQITKYKLQANIPTDGSIMSGYASVINKYAPHPCAAALAREYIFSDEGQANLAAAGAIPTRTDVEIPDDIQNATFKSEDYANAIPMEDTDAYTKACETVVERWQEEITPLLVQ